MEKLVVNPNNQTQHEYFQKDESLGIEGITVYFKPKGADGPETHFYSILTTEKAQDGNVVYANTRITLEDIADLLDNGDELVGVEFMRQILEILEDTDGCEVQYHSANSLHMLYKMATELDIIIDQGVDAPGHGKDLVDGYNGTDKTVLTDEFRGNAIH